MYPAELVSDTDLTGATVTLTATAPDGTVTTPGVTVSATIATAGVPALVLGAYLLVWTVSGTVSGVQQDQFTVVAPELDLVSLPDLKEELQLSASNAKFDAKLRRWLKSATNVIENVTGPIRLHTEVDIFDGGVDYVVLNNRWVSSIVSVVETWVTVNYTLTEQPLGVSTDAFGYTWDRDTNTIVRRGAGGVVQMFQPGWRSVQVTYNGGLAVLPDDIQLAASELIKHWYRKSLPSQMSAYGGGGAAEDAYNMPGNYMVPNAVMELLEPWRRAPGIF